MDRYFQKFPLINYNGTICKDLTRRITINNGIPKQGTLDQFYPYEISNHARADHVAGDYYKDPELDWMIYLANGIIDPYYDWYLTQDQFQSLIETKYGSFENSVRMIKYWRNNWFSDHSELSPDQFENHIDPELRKYWQPYWGPNSRVVSYIRKQEDLIVNTNRIMKYVGTVTGTFQANEPVTFHYIPQPGSTVLDAVAGLGQIDAITSGTVYVQHVRDGYQPDDDNDLAIRGTLSGAQMLVTTTTTVVQNISDREGAYWSPVTVFDWENEKNESNKDIYLVAVGPHGLISQNVQKALQENVDPITNLTRDGE